MLIFLFFREFFFELIKSVNPSTNGGFLIAIYGGFNGLLFSVIFSRLSHYAEYKADSFTAECIGDNSMVEALKKISLYTEHIIDKGGMTHPSLIKRIDNIMATKK